MTGTVCRTATPLRLLRSLRALFGPSAELVEASEREWASATFSGSRHMLDWRLQLEDEAAPLPPAFSALADHSFDLGEQIVADCSVILGMRQSDTQGQHWLPFRIEILTITAD